MKMEAVDAHDKAWEMLRLMETVCNMRNSYITFYLC